tara:strand:- start:1804 stop:1992 length:189 start_codon:yes stop_codon:yes gene_type:complete
MAKDKKIKITLIKSPIGYKEKAKKTIEALGLKKINQSVIHNSNASILGMINIVNYLVKVEEI